MITEYSISILTDTEATITLSRFIEINGERVKLPSKDFVYRAAKDIQKLKDEIPQPYLDAVLIAWGQKGE